MKKKNTFLFVFLNVAFCTLLLWFFLRNSFLRPYAGSLLRELILGAVLLGILYANYFLLYPKLYGKHPALYWTTVVMVSLLSGILEIAVARENIEVCCVQIISDLGPFNYYAKTLLFISGRNLAFNFFPFLFRERQHLQLDLDTEKRTVFQEVRMLDVTSMGEDRNYHLIPIDDIYYCEQDGNFTSIHMVQGNKYTRLGSLRHLEQIVGTGDFIRISPSLLLPYRQIKSCNGSEVFMKKTPWEKTPRAFKINPKSSQQVSEAILLHFQEVKMQRKREKMEQPRKKRNPIKPSAEKMDTVLQKIRELPGSRANGIAAQTKYSPSTVERCLSELRKQGLVEFRGSKNKGGYFVVERGEEEEEEMNKN